MTSWPSHRRIYNYNKVFTIVVPLPPFIFTNAQCVSDLSLASLSNLYIAQRPKNAAKCSKNATKPFAAWQCRAVKGPEKVWQAWWIMTKKAKRKIKKHPPRVIPILPESLKHNVPGILDLTRCIPMHYRGREGIMQQNTIPFLKICNYTDHTIAGKVFLDEIYIVWK